MLFRSIALNVPNAATTVSASFLGLSPGTDLAPDDPGEYMESETVAGTVATYNVGNAADAGWHYGFVALKKDGTRVYSDRNTEPTGVASFTLPANTEKLYFIVLGAPKQYKPQIQTVVVRLITVVRAVRQIISLLQLSL